MITDGFTGHYEASLDFDPHYFVTDCRIAAHGFVNESADSFFARRDLKKLSKRRK